MNQPGWIVEADSRSSEIVLSPASGLLCTDLLANGSAGLAFPGFELDDLIVATVTPFPEDGLRLTLPRYVMLDDEHLDAVTAVAGTDVRLVIEVPDANAGTYPATGQDADTLARWLRIVGAANTKPQSLWLHCAVLLVGEELGSAVKRLPGVDARLHSAAAVASWILTNYPRFYLDLLVPETSQTAIALADNARRYVGGNEGQRLDAIIALLKSERLTAPAPALQAFRGLIEIGPRSEERSVPVEDFAIPDVLLHAKDRMLSLSLTVQDGPLATLTATMRVSSDVYETVDEINETIAKTEAQLGKSPTREAMRSALPDSYFESVSRLRLLLGQRRIAVAETVRLEPLWLHLATQPKGHRIAVQLAASATSRGYFVSATLPVAASFDVSQAEVVVLPQAGAPFTGQLDTALLAELVTTIGSLGTGQRRENAEGTERRVVRFSKAYNALPSWMRTPIVSATANLLSAQFASSPAEVQSFRYNAARDLLPFSEERAKTVFELLAARVALISDPSEAELQALALRDLFANDRAWSLMNGEETDALATALAPNLH
jgi:hypothetical protein